METRLEQLLVSIEPESTITETFNRANHAINTFPMECAQIQEWNRFKECVGALVRHVDFNILGLGGPMAISPDFWWRQFAEPVLRAVYGGSGAKAACERRFLGMAPCPSPPWKPG